MEHQVARRVTIADVAEAAGVSKTAVSFAFNKPSRLNADTATRIIEIADSLGYRPDPVDAPADGNVLICCVQPAGDVVIDL